MGDVVCGASLRQQFHVPAWCLTSGRTRHACERPRLRRARADRRVLACRHRPGACRRARGGAAARRRQRVQARGRPPVRRACHEPTRVRGTLPSHHAGPPGGAERAIPARAGRPRDRDGGLPRAVAAGCRARDRAGRVAARALRGMPVGCGRAHARQAATASGSSGSLHSRASSGCLQSRPATCTCTSAGAVRCRTC